MVNGDRLETHTLCRCFSELLWNSPKWFPCMQWVHSLFPPSLNFHLSPFACPFIVLTNGKWDATYRHGGSLLPTILLYLSPDILQLLQQCRRPGVSWSSYVICTDVNMVCVHTFTSWQICLISSRYYVSVSLCKTVSVFARWPLKLTILKRTKTQPCCCSRVENFFLQLGCLEKVQAGQRLSHHIGPLRQLRQIAIRYINLRLTVIQAIRFELRRIQSWRLRAIYARAFCKYNTNMKRAKRLEILFHRLLNAM